jgi:hypothetical protein
MLPTPGKSCLPIQAKNSAPDKKKVGRRQHLLIEAVVKKIL